MVRVIFICTANRCRSPMAQGLMLEKWQQTGQNNLITTSMGVHGQDDQPPTNFAIEVCKQNNIDISGIRSRPIDPEELKLADLIFTMEPFQYEFIRIFFPMLDDRLFLLGAYPQKEFNKKHIIKDPVGGSLKDYKKSFDIIASNLDRIIPHIQVQFKL